MNADFYWGTSDSFVFTNDSERTKVANPSRRRLDKGGGIPKGRGIAVAPDGRGTLKPDRHPYGRHVARPPRDQVTGLQCDRFDSNGGSRNEVILKYGSVRQEVGGLAPPQPSLNRAILNWRLPPAFYGCPTEGI